MNNLSDKTRVPGALASVVKQTIHGLMVNGQPLPLKGKGRNLYISAYRTGKDPEQEETTDRFPNSHLRSSMRQYF